MHDSGRATAKPRAPGSRKGDPRMAQIDTSSCTDPKCTICSGTGGRR